MLGVSFSELIVIALIALIVFGPEKLPELLHSVGVLLGKLQREYDSVRREFYNSAYTPAEEARELIKSSARNLIAVSEPKATTGEESPNGKTEQDGK